MLQCVAVCCSVLQCVAVCVDDLIEGEAFEATLSREEMEQVDTPVAVCYSALQCVAVCCSVLQCVAVCSGALGQCHARVTRIHASVHL